MKIVDWRIDDIGLEQSYYSHDELTAKLSGSWAYHGSQSFNFDDVVKELATMLDRDKGSEEMYHANCRCSTTTSAKPKIKKVIFNNPATVIFWSDNTKSVVKCQDGEPFDAEKGFVLAYLKKLLGNDNTFNKEIHKWVD